MSVDTYLKRKNIAGYHASHHNGVELLVSDSLLRVVNKVHVRLKRTFFFKSLAVEVEPRGGHYHSPA